MDYQGQDRLETCDAGSEGPLGALQVLTLAVRDLRPCMEIRFADSVIALVALQPVPGAPAHVKGLLNVRGEGVPAVDLGELLGLPCVDRYTLDTPIVLCSAQGRRLGLIVDSVLGVETVEQHQFCQDDLVSGTALPFLGTVWRDGSQLLVLDPSRLFRKDLLTTSESRNPDSMFPGAAG